MYHLYDHLVNQLLFICLTIWSTIILTGLLTMKFTTDYHKNLGFLLEAGVPISKANSIASEITKKLRGEAKEIFRDKLFDEADKILNH